jgi:hypothetical protein
MSTRLINAPAIAFAATVALAAPASSQTAPEGGLLLGFADGRTFWIVRDSDSIRLAWQTPHLVVPRTDGYWFVESAERCGVDLGSSHGGGGPPGGAFINRSQAIGYGRAGTTIKIPLGETLNCATAAKRVVAARLREYRAAIKAGGDSSQMELPTANDPLDCTVSNDRLTFVSATTISIEHRYSQTEFCSPGGYATSGSNDVLRIDTGAGIPLRPMLPRSVRDSAEKERTTGETCAFEDSPERLDNAWIVHRFEGHWVADMFLEGPNACRGGQELELNLPLPESFTGERALPASWASLAKAYPYLTDASASPSGSFLAVRIGDKLTVYRLRNGAIGEVVGQISGLSADEIVMIRWATPSEATRWTRDLPRLVAPKIRVVKS